MKKIIGDLSNEERVLVGLDFARCRRGFVTATKRVPKRARGTRRRAPPLRAARVPRACSASGASRAGRRRPGRLPVLRLYVTGITPASRKAIERVRSICEEHLQGRYELEVVDIYQLPALAKDRADRRHADAHQGAPCAAAALHRGPVAVEKVLFGLDLREKR